MFEVVLYQPEIPPNTGNVVRLCVNTDARLHLIHPLGFSLDDRQLRRAGLDYRERAELREYPGWPQFLEAINPPRVFACSTRGERYPSEVAFQPGDALLFGPETRGLPAELLESLPLDQRIRIPMTGGNRSLNLSNAVAVVLYEAWRQNGYQGSVR